MSGEAKSGRYSSGTSGGGRQVRAVAHDFPAGLVLAAAPLGDSGDARPAWSRR
ncbi:hypothetical protein L3Q67_32620 [Saccharothrix sp. AJ9571]|nr:hypothetical protein L3Q67_32620 [Saccharothrix sp. AJ9571]